MAEHDTEPFDLADGESRAWRRRPQVFTLLAGVATLMVSAYLLTDGHRWLPAVDPRWVLAGGALAVGLLLLALSLRPSGDRDR